jgi:hypothetical protein
MQGATWSMKRHEERDKKSNEPSASVLFDLPDIIGSEGAGQCLVLRMTCSPHMFAQPMDKKDPMLILIIVLVIIEVYFLLTISEIPKF